MKFTASLTANDPLAAAAKAVLEAKFGTQTPANKLAALTKNEEYIDEARINGFQANRAVVNAQENLARVKTAFLPTSILARTVAQDVGAGVKADFEKITKLLEQVEDIWEQIYMEGSMAYDANINK